MNEENSIEFWRNKCVELEARIKASQEQEPVAAVELITGAFVWLTDERTNLLFASPIIPPEVAELVGWCPVCDTVRMSLPKPAEGSCSHCFNHLMKLASAYDLQELQRENAELTRKLAEQQARDNSIGKWLSAMLDDENVCGEMKADIVHWFTDNAEEFTKLIEEAKRQAVPEGWKLVPIEPTVEDAICVYKAMLSAAPQPERKD